MSHRVNGGDAREESQLPPPAPLSVPPRPPSTTASPRLNPSGRRIGGASTPGRAGGHSGMPPSPLRQEMAAGIVPPALNLESSARSDSFADGTGSPYTAVVSESVAGSSSNGLFPAASPARSSDGTSGNGDVASLQSIQAMGPYVELPPTVLRRASPRRRIGSGVSANEIDTAASPTHGPLGSGGSGGSVVLDGGAGDRQAGHGAGYGVSEREQALNAAIQDVTRKIAELKQEYSHNEDEAANPPGTDGAAAINDDMRGATVVIVANRLPVQGKWGENGELILKESSGGGLVTALQGVSGFDILRIGWFDLQVPEEEQPAVTARMKREFKCVPVFLEESLVDRYYNGFCNDVLWPLFHYVPLPIDKAGAEKKFDDGLWEAYKQANVAFAEVVSAHYCEGDYVWVHDYHLMHLPSELRKRHPNSRIGWFLHTPFPSSEIYRILPVRKPLLEGLLAADLVGFHTYDYARHFLSACSRVLEVQCTPRGVEYGNRFMTLGVFPCGIDPNYVAGIMRLPSVQNRIGELSSVYKGSKILLGVDRVDPIKGMPHKLLAFELFLTRHPEWRGKVTLIQVGVPSRLDVPEYKSLSNQVNELVGRIKGKWGTLEYSPVNYINQSLKQEELFAIYNVADVCLVTSVRDGMNLVSHEYVAAQHEPRRPDLPARDGPGVLVLSEFAGSAQSLGGALRVNPWNTEELAKAIHVALTLTPLERKLRQAKLHRYVNKHTASFWAASFMQEFGLVCRRRMRSSNKLPPLPVSEVVEAYAKAKNRLIISDYDGTLTQLQSLPQLAGPSPLVTSLLESLAADNRNSIFIVSGRERRFMETWLGKLRLGLAAEYGFYYRLPGDGENQWNSIGEELDLSWKDVVRPIMQYFTERTPGTYVEYKESSLSWHYRDADPHFGLWQAKDMQMHMEDLLGNMPLEILQGNRMVEVRHQAANKSALAEVVLQIYSEPAVLRERGEVDFIFCVGDDKSDEDMFQTVKRLRDLAAEQPTPMGSPLPSTEQDFEPSLAALEELEQEPVDLGAGFASSTAFGTALGGSSGGGSGGGQFGSGSSAMGGGDQQSVRPAAMSSAVSLGQAVIEAPMAPRVMKRDAAVYTVHIGSDKSHARFQLDSIMHLRQLLRKFEEVSRREREDS